MLYKVLLVRGSANARFDQPFRPATVTRCRYVSRSLLGMNRGPLITIEHRYHSPQHPPRADSIAAMATHLGMRTSSLRACSSSWNSSSSATRSFTRARFGVAAPAIAAPRCSREVQSAMPWPALQRTSANGSSFICRSSDSPEQGTSSSSEGGVPTAALNAGLLALWAALLGYVFVLAPNQTPSIDSFVVQKLVGLKGDDPFQVNEVFTSVWNFMGLYPLLYAAVLIPGARSDKVPAWPFVCASVFLGAYALIPYMCLWSPKSPPEQLPPPAAELEGWNKGFLRAAETPWLPAGLLAGSAFWLLHAVTAGGEAWLGYLQLFDESRLVHATSVDFALCTLLMPFWMANDAQGRKWQNSSLVPLLCCLPLVGPSIYLLLRPKTYAQSSSSSSSDS